MDLYGQKSASRPQKTVILTAEVLLVALSWLALFSEAMAGVRWSGDAPLPARSIVLFTFNVVVFVRFLFTLFYFLKRSIPWEEAVSVPMAFALYLVGFPLLARGADVPFGWPEVAGIALFVAGSLLNSLSELQRKRFKDDAENRGKLYTGGLFSLSIHVNYFGDVLWVLGYALVTHNVVALAIPALLFVFFAFHNIPKLDAYLREHYGDDFVAWEKGAKRFIPFVW